MFEELSNDFKYVELSHTLNDTKTALEEIIKKHADTLTIDDSLAMHLRDLLEMITEKISQEKIGFGG